jgi:hypothetical protein
MASVLAFTALSCSGPTVAPTAPASVVTVTSIAVTGTTPAVGGSTQFAAVATLSNGTTQVVTNQAIWQSSNPTIATVGSAGLVTAVAPGDVEISATYQAVSGRAQMRIAVPVPRMFTVTGVVTDGTSGGVLPNIAVQLLSGSATPTVNTDGAGVFVFREIAAGTYTLRLSAISYQTVERVVTIAQDTRVDVVLPRALLGTSPRLSVSPFGHDFLITGIDFTPHVLPAGFYVETDLVTSAVYSAAYPGQVPDSTGRFVNSYGHLCNPNPLRWEVWFVDGSTNVSSNHVTYVVPIKPCPPQ